MIPSSFVLFRIDLDICDSLWFPMNCRIVKKIFRILIEIVLNLSIALDGMNILTILSLPIDENGKFFHLFISKFLSSVF